MAAAFQIRNLQTIGDREIAGLSDVLIDCVEGGASVSFMLPMTRAKAEERRAFAVAMEQENLALVQENRAKVIAAEAEVPLAIADAFRKGNLGITDYYHLRNIQADTEMRSAIAGTSNSTRREIPAGT